MSRFLILVLSLKQYLRPSICPSADGVEDFFFVLVERAGSENGRSAVGAFSGSLLRLIHSC